MSLLYTDFARLLSQLYLEQVRESPTSTDTNIMSKDIQGLREQIRGMYASCQLRLLHLT